MAKKTIVSTEYTDDFDGSAAAGTVTFGFDGTSYEIDLSRSNTRAFERALKPYVDAARKVRTSRNRVSSRRATSKRDLGAVRAWAAANGYEVSVRGRIAQTVIAAYEAAN